MDDIQKKDSGLCNVPLEKLIEELVKERTKEEVEAKLKKDESGRVLPTLENLIRVLRYDPELQGAFFLYEDYIRVTRPFEWMGERGSLCEIDLGYLLHYMEEVYGLRGSTKNLLRAIALTAEQ